MPETDVIIYREEDGTCPLTDWLDGLPQKAREKCIVRIERLAEKGHELRRPDSDYLRDKIYELRAALQRVQYRMLYFFHGKQCVITHGFIKEGSEVPPKEISLAIARKDKFENNPMEHTMRG